ncbi:MAG: hypothetical protein ACO3ZY_09040 [Phycisphaerales bacterium]
MPTHRTTPPHDRTCSGFSTASRGTVGSTISSAVIEISVRSPRHN